MSEVQVWRNGPDGTYGAWQYSIGNAQGGAGTLKEALYQASFLGKSIRIVDKWEATPVTEVGVHPTKLELTEMGKFVVKHSVMVPRELWSKIISHTHDLLNKADSGEEAEDAWQMFLDELRRGCNTLLTDDEFLRIFHVDHRECGGDDDEVVPMNNREIVDSIGNTEELDDLCEKD